jgi:hypothetical protein
MAIDALMIKTQIQLKEDDYKKLREIGIREDKGLAEQVREAVSMYLARHSDSPLPPVSGLKGRFHRMPSPAIDELKPHDRWFAESVLESKRR